MYPTDNHIQALTIDEIIDTVNEANSKVPQHPDAETRRKLREEWSKKDLFKYLSFFSRKLEQSPSKYIVGDKLSIADLYAYSFICVVRAGIYT